MSVLKQKLASEIFEILKSYGKTLILYDDTGNVTYDPNQASRIFISPEKMMLSIINDNDDDIEVKLYLSNSVILSDQMKLINTLRQVTTRLNSLFNVRKYGKELSPKDFAYQVTTEGLHEKYWGTCKTSYSNIGNCKVIFHHLKHIDEEKKGSRSRNIKNIYIENINKEKILLPSNNIHAAKALARHLSSGGKVFDKIGDYIIECSKEYDILKKSLKNIKESINDDILKNTIIKSVKTRLYDINRTFDIIRGIRNYKKYNKFFSNKSLYEFTSYDLDVENNIRNNIISDKINDAIPYIISIMSNKKSLLPTIEINDDFKIVSVIQSFFKRKFKYGLDYIIDNNLIIFYNPQVLTEIIYYLDKNKISYNIISDSVIDDSLHITNKIKIDDIQDIKNILTTELGLELNTDYTIVSNIINFLSSNIYSDVINFLNTTNINFIDLSENDDYNKKDTTLMVNQNDKVYQFAKNWIEKNTDIGTGYSSEDSVHDRESIENKSEQLSNELKLFMKTNSLNGVDDTPRKFNDKRAEQAYKISAVASSNIEGDMIFNFLTNIAEKIRNSENLDTNEKAVAKKAIDLFNTESKDETVKEDENLNNFHNIVSISWNSEIPEKLRDILEKIPFGTLIASEGNNRKGYINYEILQNKEDLFNRSVKKYILNYDCVHIVKISGTKEVKKPMSKTSKWKQFLGFKEEAELDEWFAQFDPEKIISEEDNTEEDYIIDPNEDEDELLLSDIPDIEISISESIFSDAKTEDKLCSDIEDINSGTKLTFAYIDDAGKYVIYDEVTNTPIKEYRDEEVADKICDLYNSSKYEQAKELVKSSLEKSLEELRKSKDEEELNEAEIREKAINKKINDYALSQYSPSYEIDVNRAFGLERQIPVAEQFSIITTISEQLFNIAKKNRMFENYKYTPYIFESSAVDLFHSDIKPRLKECGFVFISDKDEDDNIGFEREPTEQDIIRATKEYNDIINGINIDLSEGELDNVINDSSKDFNIEEYFDKSYLDKFKKGELPVHILDAKIAKALYHEADNKGLLGKIDFTLSPENFMGRASQIVSDYINNLHEDSELNNTQSLDDFKRSIVNDYNLTDYFFNIDLQDASFNRHNNKSNDHIINEIAKTLYDIAEQNGLITSDDITQHDFYDTANDILNRYFSRTNNDSIYEDDNQSPIDVARRMGYDAERTGDKDKFNSSLRSLMNDHPGDKQREDIHKAYISGMDDYKSENLHEKDLGKPGKNFSKIAKSAAKEYGSKEAGEKVAGAVLSKLRKEHPEEYKESINSIESMHNVIGKLNSIFDNKSMFEVNDESPYDIARRMGYQAAKNGKTDTFNSELHSMLDDKPGSKHNKQIHSAFMQGMDDYENEHKMSEDLEDETLEDSDVTIPTNVQTTFKNDVSSDIMDNPDMDMINDIRRRAGLI